MLKLSLRTIAAHKARFVMTTFAVVLGVAFVVGSLVVTDTVRSTFKTLFAQINSGIDLSVRSSRTFDSGPGGQGREPVDASLVEIVRSVDGVAAAEGTISREGAAPIAPDGDPVTTTAAPLLGVSWGEVEELYPFIIEQGRQPRRDEIAIDKDTFEDFDFELDTPVDVVTLSGRESFQLVGTFRFGETNSLAGARLTAFEPGTAQRVLGFDGTFSTVDLRLEPGADSGEVAADLERVLPDEVEVVTGEEIAQEDSDQIDEFLTIFGNVLLGFACVALFVSAFYINNTFSIILGQRIRELALLRAIGASGAQVAGSVLIEALVVGVLASFVGVGAGFVTALGLRGLLNAGGFGMPPDALVFTGRTWIAAFAIGVGVTFASAISPARKAATVPPMAAIRDGLSLDGGSRRWRLITGAIMTGLGVLFVANGLLAATETMAIVSSLALGAILVFLGVARLSPLVAGPVARVIGAPIARIFRTPGRLSRDNATRNPFRTAKTASALMVGLALVTMALVVGTSLKDSFAEAAAQSLRADFVISDDTFTGFTPRIGEELDERPEFGAVTPVRFDSFRFEGAGQSITGLDAEEAGELIDLDFRAGRLDDLDADSIAIHRDPADDLGLQVGDSVDIEFTRTGEQTFSIAGIYEDASLLQTNYVISLDAWQTHFTDQIDALVFASAADSVEPSEAATALEAVTKDFPQVNVDDQSEFLASQQGQIDQVLLTVNVLLLLAITIAMLGIANTLALSVFERTRELGLLRAVGMSRRQTRRMVRWEAAIVSVFGAVLGVAVGVAFGLAFVGALPSGIITTVSVPPGPIIQLIVLAGVAGLLAAIFPARRAGRLDVLDAIARE